MNRRPITMHKLFLSFIFLTLSFLLGETQARSLPCKFHNSNNCIDPVKFQEELASGCVRPAGNCRYKFCKANCRDVSLPEVRPLCKAQCLNTRLLSRFNMDQRRALYAGTLPTEGLTPRQAIINVTRALSEEMYVLQAKNKKWKPFGRKTKNSKLYEDLTATRRTLADTRDTDDERREAERKEREAREEADRIKSFYRNTYLGKTFENGIIVNYIGQAIRSEDRGTAVEIKETAPGSDPLSVKYVIIHPDKVYGLKVGDYVGFDKTSPNKVLRVTEIGPSNSRLLVKYKRLAPPTKSRKSHRSSR